MSRRARLLGLLAALAGVLVLLVPSGVPSYATGSRPGPVGSDDFVAGHPYRGDFPDPTVLRVGSRWYAFATTIAYRMLPELVSTDLVHWSVHPAWRGGGNDALRAPARWAATVRVHGRPFAATWAPSVARLAPSSYLAAYAEPVRGSGSGNARKFCVSVATAPSPLGPFTDRSTRPLVCPADQGAIDPQVFVAPNHAKWLLYKTEGTHSTTTTVTNPDGSTTTTTVPGDPASLWSQRLAPNGTSLYPGSQPASLLSVAEPWEGHVVENPAMFAYGGGFYLFYSGNDWSSSAYAIGYARCSTMSGPCTRVGDGRLLTTRKPIAGPGGAVPFLEGGTVRMAYHAWSYGHVGYPTTDACRRTAAGCAQRRLHVGTLSPQPDGSFVVSRLG